MAANEHLLFTVLLWFKIIQIRKISQKRLVISFYYLIKDFVGSAWVKLGGKTSQQIPFVFAIYILKKISLKAIYRYVFFYLPLKLCVFVCFIPSLLLRLKSRSVRGASHHPAFMGNFPTREINITLGDKRPNPRRLTLSWWKPLSYSYQSINLLCKSVTGFYMTTASVMKELTELQMRLRLAVL